MTMDKMKMETKKQVDFLIKVIYIKGNSVLKWTSHFLYLLCLYQNTVWPLNKEEVKQKLKETNYKLKCYLVSGKC